MSDYIKRDALMDAIEHLDWYQPAGKGRLSAGAADEQNAVYKAEDIYRIANIAPSANVIELPEGKPDDFLLWDTGCGHLKLYAINAVCFYADSVRYDLGEIEPVVDHRSIVKIMNREEAEKYLRGDDNGKEA